MRFEVTASPLAAEQLRGLKERAAASPGTRHEKTYVALRQVLDALALDMAALRSDNRLKGNLANVWRDKTGRWRVFYLVSSARQKVVVLMLGDGRKAGDRNDPYAVFERYLKRGQFDAQFADLGVTKPKL